MKHIHMIGIGGTGLSAIARVLLELGYAVSGSDRQYSQLAQSVQAAGAQFYLGHKPEHVKCADVVVRSSAVSDDNVEVQAARVNGVPVLKRAEFLDYLLEAKQVIAVAGTHGKTSTTAMIAWILTELGQKPSFIVGGVVAGLETNAKAGDGKAFVIEADEYDRMFLGLKPDIAVVTNVEHDHPDCYPTPEDFRNAFQMFVGQIKPGGCLLACGDRFETAELLLLAEKKGNRSLTYGINNLDNTYLAVNVQANPTRGGFDFQATRNGLSVTSVSLQVPGRHNVENALAALAVGDQMGLSLSEAAQALANFKGTGRRFEIIGESQGVLVVSDYAHHPTEIKATLAAARSRYQNQSIWAVWQPHTYSRTKLLLDAFAASFEDADHVLITDVYPAREPLDRDFSILQILGAMEHPDVSYTGGLPDAAAYLVERLTPGDVLLVLSAGDADLLCTMVLENLNERP